MAVGKVPLEVERFWYQGKLYVSQMKRCGKSNCRTCPHGPYWSKVRAVVKGRAILTYLGKFLPTTIEVARLQHRVNEDMFGRRS
jgi:hypothetical protein